MLDADLGSVVTVLHAAAVRSEGCLRLAHHLWLVVSRCCAQTFLSVGADLLKIVVCVQERLSAIKEGGGDDE